MPIRSVHEQQVVPLLVENGGFLRDLNKTLCFEYTDDSNDDDGSCSSCSYESSGSMECDVLDEVERPVEWLKSYLSSQGFPNTPKSYESCRELFLQVTEEHISGYDMEVSSAARKGDLEKLCELFESGKSLQVCNRFGESIVHIAARRGNAPMLQYLMEQAGVSVRVCCDTGRTPLHDACWTKNPNFDCIRLLLEECPEFLRVADNRGFTPLCYVPEQCWGEWLAFLSENQYLVLPHTTVEVERFL